MEAPLFHLALVGTSNSGKTALFNALTGSRQFRETASSYGAYLAASHRRFLQGAAGGRPADPARAAPAHPLWTMPAVPGGA